RTPGAGWTSSDSSRVPCHNVLSRSQIRHFTRAGCCVTGGLPSMSPRHRHRVSARATQLSPTAYDLLGDSRPCAPLEYGKAFALKDLELPVVHEMLVAGAVFDLHLFVEVIDLTDVAAVAQLVWAACEHHPHAGHGRSTPYYGDRLFHEVR